MFLFGTENEEGQLKRLKRGGPAEKNILHIVQLCIGNREEIGNVGLDALPVQDLTFTRAVGKICTLLLISFKRAHSLAGFVDDLLEQVGELLDDCHRLSRCETYAVHRGCCVVR